MDGWVDAIVGSPPYAETALTVEEGRTQQYTRGKSAGGSPIVPYGTHPAQLGAMRPGTPGEEHTMTATIPVEIWTGCYDGSWKGAIVPAAFCHPAKAARGLLCRILDFMLAEGWLQKGDTVLDCFSGVATTAIEAASRGLQAIGCELEERFHKLALENLELHRRTWEAFGDPFPVLVCGDSRNLVRVLQTAGVAAVVSSPPWSECDNYRGESKAEFENQRQAARGRDPEGHGHKASFADYGTTPGQLGALPPGTPPDALGADALCGEGAGAIVSSPPFEQSIAPGRDPGDKLVFGNARYGHKDTVTEAYTDYGHAPGQLGNEQGDTFWAAAKQILEQCYLVLKPGGVAAWICKDFIRDGKRVPFTQQWATLCAACGLEPFLWVQASLVKEERHPSLFGGDEVKTSERKSFFRRLAERRGSPKIDHEGVIFCRKVGQ